MLRDLTLLAFCCLLAAGFWFSKSSQTEQAERLLQEDLYDLGAPQAMEESAERLMLRGDFRQALQSSPNPALYNLLAELFLVSFEVRTKPVSAYAFDDHMMMRVENDVLEFFDSQGRPLSPEVFELGEDIRLSSKPLFTCVGPLQIKNQSPWFLYRDQKRSLLVRLEGDQLKGYLSKKKLTVSDDEVLADGVARWRWMDGDLLASVSQSPSPKTDDTPSP